MLLTATIRTDDGESVGVIVLGEKQFQSGSVGYHGQAKIEIDGKRHQAQCQVVAIAAKRGDVEAEG